MNEKCMQLSAVAAEIVSAFIIAPSGGRINLLFDKNNFVGVTGRSVY